MAIMIDSVSPASIHEAAAKGIAFDIVCGWLDGAYGPKDPAGWTAEAWAQFPGKELIRIAALKDTLGADAYDVERGDLVPADVPGVLRRERATGRNPAMYSDDSTWPDVFTGSEGTKTITDSEIRDGFCFLAHFLFPFGIGEPRFHLGVVVGLGHW